MDRAIPEFRALSRAWARPRKLGVVAWAERCIVLPSSYSQGGRLCLGTSRYLIEPLETFVDPATKHEDVLKAIKMGGTMIAEIGLAYLLAYAPGPIMWTHQTDDDAREHMKGRGWAMLKGIRQIRDMLPASNRHDITDLSIYFGDFAMWVNGASRNNAQGKDIRYKVNSETWLWKQGLLAQFNGRTSAFEQRGLSKILNESQASECGTDWEASWLTTDQREWSVPCPRCRTVRPLNFFGVMDDDPKVRACVVWDKEAHRPDGTWDEDRLRKSTRYRCAKCGHEQEDSGKTRVEWNDTGRYVAARPDRSAHPGFRFNALPGHPLENLAAMWMHAVERKARGDITAMRDFYLQRLAIFFRRDAEEQKPITIKTAGYTLADVAAHPLEKIPGEVSRMLLVDVQRDHYWAGVLGWRADGACRVLYRSKLLTDGAIEEVRERYGITPRLTVLDAQHDTGRVYDLCAKMGYVAAHGSGQNGFPWGTGKTRHTRLYSPISRAKAPSGGIAHYFHWASDPVKDMVFAALQVGRIELAEDIDQQPEGWHDRLRFTRQLQGEVKVQRISKTTGKEEWRWKKTSDNHYWDCLAIGHATAMILDIVSSPEGEDSEVDETTINNGADNRDSDTGA